MQRVFALSVEGETPLNIAQDGVRLVEGLRALFGPLASILVLVGVHPSGEGPVGGLDRLLIRLGMNLQHAVEVGLHG